MHLTRRGLDGQLPRVDGRGRNNGGRSSNG
jgi:hypothetical protein